jgi:hypothetical protein
MEKKRKEIHSVQQEHKKIKEIYRLDYERMQILLNKLRNEADEIEEKLVVKHKENENLVDKKLKIDEETKNIDNDLSDLQYTNKMLPDQLLNIQNHLTVT